MNGLKQHHDLKPTKKRNDNSSRTKRTSKNQSFNLQQRRKYPQHSF
ncbi:MAG: hypothetical protein LBT09_05130 [Planctomycetaceae bacterium]|nr:hypothetical protein [Planctomycetaceae bacterium]